MTEPAAADSPRQSCSLCQAGDPDVRGVAEGRGPSAAGLAGTVAYRDDELVAVIDHDAPGVLLAPRSHIEGLEVMPGRAGTVLAALRRAASTVETTYGVSGTSIEPTTELPGAPGHVCYRIVPSANGTPLPRGASTAVDPDVLAAALRQVAEERTLLPPG